MNIIKYILLFTWALLLLGIMCFIINQLTFGKRRLDANINFSEGIYLASMVISMGILLESVMKFINIAFDNISKIYPNDVYVQLLKTSSAISVSGALIFIISLYVSRALTSLYFPGRNDLVEFTSDNKSFALVRGALMIAVSFVLIQIGENIFGYLIPNITLPFYR